MLAAAMEATMNHILALELIAGFELHPDVVGKCIKIRRRHSLHEHGVAADGIVKKLVE